MKKLLFAILLLPMFALAQPPPIQTRPLTVTQATPHAVGPTGYTSGIITDAMSALTDKPWCRLIANSNTTLSGIGTIDGIAFGAGELILLTAQTAASQNGPWIAAAGAWSRPAWYASGNTTQAFENIAVHIRVGTQFGGTWWRTTTLGAITIDTTSTAWSQTASVATAGIVNAAVTYAKIQSLAGLSVFGRSANTTGVGADITGTNGQVLQVLGTTLGFGPFPTPTITPYPSATPYPTGTPFPPVPTATPYPTTTPYQSVTSAQLAAAVTDETGTAGFVVFSVSPSITGTMLAQVITMSGNLNLAAGTAVTYNGQNVIRANTTLGNYFFGPTGNLTATGTNNVAVGVNTLGSVTTGGFNAAIGYSALNGMTTGSDNLALGAFAGVNINSGSSNCAFGSSALVSLTTGSTNSAFGRESLTGLTNGGANTAMGKDAIRDVTTGGNNTAVGAGTGRGITTGSNNTILGANVTGLAAVLANTIIISDGQGHYYTTTVSATGAVVFDAVGTGAAFTFNDPVGITNIPAGSPTPTPQPGKGILYVGDGALKYISPSDGVGGSHTATLANQ